MSSEKGENVVGSKFKINTVLLPIKIHYFIFFAALAGLIPFLPVFAKQLGISSTALGLIYTILPILVMIFRPLVGSLVDHFQNLRLILIVMLVLTIVFYLAIYFTPHPANPLGSKIPMLAEFECFTNDSGLFLNFKNMSCISIHLYDETNDSFCGGLCNKCFPSMHLDIQGIEENIERFNNFTTGLCNEKSQGTFEINSLIRKSDIFQNATDFLFESHFTCSNLQNMSCFVDCNFHTDKCFISRNVYKTLQFWLFFIFSIIGWVASGVTVSLSDTACHEMLVGTEYEYGKQRLWGTLGWGVAAVLSGYLIRISSKESTFVDYSPGFFVLAVLLFCDIFVILFAKVSKPKPSKHMKRDLGNVLKQGRTIGVIIVIFIIGCLMGLLWSYLFWYLENLGADQLLMGIVLAIQCFIGELPFFFFSEWIINKISCIHVFTLSLASFGIRFILYSLIKNPWHVLPLELLQGPGFGSFYTAMTLYAKTSAPPGTEATMQGILGGCFEGLGVAVGSLLGGVGFDHLGGGLTFQVAGLIALVACGLHCIFHFILNRIEAKKALQKSVSRQLNETTLFLKPSTSQSGSSSSPLEELSSF
ncbi:major facilitator superfamily domain-containing protein 6-like [Limulus polyphemus]|uniref:Major facilitator superfamily domain-containing protein 6-like n=1 Tax=Limulus polyphemus TaxID=6850 RepID=A0ABM1BYE8_LIMPO|nr:major facilitator superfamily domain-containing protein 6-like [Limulus polyphemus]